MPRKSQSFIELKSCSEPYSQPENFVKTSEKLWKIEIELFHMKTSVCVVFFFSKIAGSTWWNSFGKQ